MNIVDRIVVSTNEDPRYLQCWPLAAASWNKFFPEAAVSLAFVTNRRENDPLVTKMREFGEVELIPPQKGVKTGWLAQISRHLLAASKGKEVCLLDDIDLLPLQRRYLAGLLEKRGENRLLLVGYNAYRGKASEGKWPMVYTTAEGSVFREILEGGKRSFTAEQPPDIRNLVDSWRGMRVYDGKEDIETKGEFADESWFRVLLARWEGKRDEVPEFVPFYGTRVSRVQQIDLQKLQNGFYTDAHLPRPPCDYPEHVGRLAEFLGCGQWDVFSDYCPSLRL